MKDGFWMGFVVGLLVGIIATGVAVVLWFVPVRSSTVPADPSSAPAAIEAPVGEGLETVVAWG